MDEVRDVKDPTGFSAKDELEAVGGVQGLRSGDWFLKLVGRSLRSYSKNGRAEYFRTKYPSLDDAAIAAKLISVAARNAALVGGTAGAAITADEIAALWSLGLTTPANIAVAVAAVGADLISVTHIQLKLISELAVLHGTPLDPDDPEDILLVIGYFMAGKAGDAVGAASVRVGGHLARSTTKQVFSKETLKLVQKIASRVGVKLLQRTLVSVAVPVVSIGLGAGSNYLFTRTLGKRASKGMQTRARDMALPVSSVVVPN